MAGRALLIGADNNDLRGVENDVLAMEAALKRRGFEPRRCLGEDATRERILAAYEQLIDEVVEDEPVVIFFSGHGCFADAHDAGDLNLQYIVPNDYVDPTKDEFRGITSVELSILQDRLSDKTRNITVVLDCCHSAQMSRDPNQWTKGSAPTEYEFLKAHLDRLEAAGLRVDRWKTEGNEHAVRIVACSPRELAFEHRNEQGLVVGVLTESLVKALDDAFGHAVTWAAVMDRVRSRIVGSSYEQRPDVEGPSDRLLFELAKADLLMSLPVTVLDESGRARLDGAPLLEVRAGDEFMVMPSGATHADHDARIGDLTIDDVSSLSAEGEIAFAPGWSRESDGLLGARAFRTRIQAPLLRVRVPVDEPGSADLATALDAGSLVEVMRPGEPDWVAEVRIDADGGLTVCDHIGPLHAPRKAGQDGIAQVTKDLKVLAQATQLRRLVGTPWCALEADVDIEWGLAVDGQRRPLLPGAVVRPGERIYVHVHNRSPETVYVSMLDIGVAGKITLITAGSPSGWEVLPNASYTFGENRKSHQLTGAPISWPAEVDAAYGRPETILIAVTSAPQDLRALEQPGIAHIRSGTRHRSRTVSPLQDMVDQLAIGGTRDLTAEDAPEADVIRYDIHAISFNVDKAGPGQEGAAR